MTRANNNNGRAIQERFYQIIEKPTILLDKLIDQTMKQIIQHRNNLLPYQPKRSSFSRIYTILLIQWSTYNCNTINKKIYKICRSSDNSRTKQKRH